MNAVSVETLSYALLLHGAATRASFARRGPRPAQPSPRLLLLLSVRGALSRLR